VEHFWISSFNVEIDSFDRIIDILLASILISQEFGEFLEVERSGSDRRQLSCLYPRPITEEGVGGNGRTCEWIWRSELGLPEVEEVRGTFRLWWGVGRQQGHRSESNSTVNDSRNESLLVNDCH